MLSQNTMIASYKVTLTSFSYNIYKDEERKDNTWLNIMDMEWIFA